LKYIIHSDIELYSSHGPLRVNQIYEAFMTKNLARDFKIAGFGPQGKELTSAVLDIKEVTCPTGYVVRVTAQGLSINDNLIFYPGQKFLDIVGKSVDIETVVPGDLLVSLNGMIRAEFVGELEVQDDMQTFYIIEVNENMTTLYANNIVVFPIEEEAKTDSFFTK